MYAEVIVLSGKNKNLDREFSYLVPSDLENKIKIGALVYVFFGKSKKLQEAIVINLTEKVDFDLEKIKPIEKIDDEIFIDKKNIELAKWMKEKYYCDFASCLRLMLPNQKSVRNENFEFDFVEPENNFLSGKKILTSEQEDAKNFILDKIYKKDLKPILLHGVTGSGKTEVYFNVMEKILAEGKQIIVLLPEISLTTQMTDLFFSRFKNKIGLMHSKLSKRERFINWKNANENKIFIMLGARSALFSPFKNLGLIIIDEEHEASYQSEITPKYNVYEVAKKICYLHKANLILGSATPSIKTYYFAQEKKIYLLEMKNRVNKKNIETDIVDMRQELLSGNKNIFSEKLFCEIKKTLDKNQQVILFLNRRGYANFVSCRKCGLVLKCNNCDVSYVFYNKNKSLVCNYCGKKILMPEICPDCKSKYIKAFGMGTEKIELETRKMFGDKKILRMDSDVIKKKSDYEKAIKLFFEHKADILIGTQMIAKGLNFPNVRLVGVICADVVLNNGDFNSSERTFELLSQVSGRAGRNETDARAIIQTYNPEHYSIICAKNNDYKSFYEQEINFRKLMDYPPFTNIFCVLMSSRDLDLLKTKIDLLKKIMIKCDRKNKFEILGPAPAIISKIKNNYRERIFIKHKNEEELKKFVLFCVNFMQAKKLLVNIKINLSLNPSFMI